MEIFGAKVDERLTAVEASATDASAKVDAYEGRISDLEAVNVDTERRLKEAEEAAKAATAAVQQLEEKMKSSPASSASHGGPGQRVPYEKRVLAKIGNLGWNDKPDVILARAREVLQAAEIPDTDFSGLSAPRREGSQAELCFKSPEVLQKARLHVRALRKSFDTTPNGKTVWLDVLKDRAELRPARIVHRAFDMIEEMEAKMQPPLKLEKRLDGKYIKAEGNKRIGFVAGGQWHWSPWARARYPSDALDEAKQYADEE